MENVNYIENKQFPSIDLRDKSKRIAIQVTSDESIAKVKDCLKKFLGNGLDKDYDTLYIVMLVRKQRSYSKTSIDKARKNFPFSCDNILDMGDLYKILNAQNCLKDIETVLKYLEEQFCDKFEYDVYQKYYNDLADYDDSIVRQYEYVDISGYSPRINTLQVKVSLSDLYVNQILKQHSNNVQYDVPISRLLLHGSKSVVLGDPGSGKSTLMKWLMFDICSHRELYIADLPIYIKCAAYAQKMMREQIDLGAYILSTLNKKNERVYLEALSNSSAIVLLDGLDEINDVSLRHNVVESINTFSAQNPKCRIVVTSRKIGYNETRLDPHFSHYELLQFNAEQIYEFIKNWYMAVEGEQIEEQDIKEFIHSIRRNPSVYRLAGTPLLLMIICLIQYQGIKLPENRVELYEIATATLLENWVNKRTRYGKETVSKRLLIGLLSPVAFDMQENCDDGVITEAVFREKIIEVYRKKVNVKNDFEIEKEIDSLINYIKTEAGFLREIGVDERGKGQFSFIHLTFQEYFAAIKMASKWQLGMDDKELQQYVLAPHWSEVVVLTAEELYMTGSDPELGCEFASRFISQVLRIKDDIVERDRPIQLVMRMLQNGVVVKSELLQQIIDAILNNKRGLYFHNGLPQNGIVHDLFIKTLVDKFNSQPTNRQICGLMMDLSDDPTINAALIKCLDGENIEAKERLFNYNTVYPVAPITKTDIFRKSITKFVNSKEGKVEGRLRKYIPTQYTLSYVNDDDEVKSRQVMAAIKAIEQTDLRQEYAEEVYREVLWGGVEELKAFSAMLKLELPDVNCHEIDKHIVDVQFKQKLENEIKGAIELIDSYTGYRVYYVKESKKLILTIENNIHYLSPPYSIENIKIPSIGNIAEFNTFLRLLVNFIDNEKVEFNNGEEFCTYSKYFRLLHWDIDCISSDRDALLDYFFNNIELTIENIRQYIKIFDAHWNRKLYSLAGKESVLKFIISADLTVTEKVIILSCFEINRKYIKPVHDIVSEYINSDPDPDINVPNLAYALMQRI